MKKLFLFAAVAVFGLTMNAQEFKLGANVGLPVGDAGDAYTFGIAIDANYLWEVADSFKAGAAVGYLHALGDSIDTPLGSFDIDDAGFLPIAAASSCGMSADFYVGLDLGYALGISPSGNDGGFYYAPRVQYSVSESLDIVAAYRGISRDGGSFNVITLGVEFGL